MVYLVLEIQDTKEILLKRDMPHKLPEDSELPKLKEEYRIPESFKEIEFGSDKYRVGKVERQVKHSQTTNNSYILIPLSRIGNCHLEEEHKLAIRFLEANLYI